MDEIVAMLTTLGIGVIVVALLFQARTGQGPQVTQTLANVPTTITGDLFSVG